MGNRMITIMYKGPSVTHFKLRHHEAVCFRDQSPVTGKPAWRLDLITPQATTVSGHYPTRAIAESTARIMLRAYP